ncbi:ATP-binding protein [Streptomyces sp. ODS28]|uniref:ATP-binding protein n=1 Tax=Streptomyces sp. ODS28 TaxID=3136688 RepID=UPI0031E7056E
MEPATSPPEARFPTASHAWWSVPAGICAATVVTLTAGPDGAWLPVLIAGTVATVTTALCVGRLLKAERRLRHAAAQHTAQSEQTHRQWQQWLDTVEKKHSAEVSTLREKVERQSELMKAEVMRLAQEFLPRAVTELRDGEAVDDVLSPLAEDPDVPEEFRAAFRKVLLTSIRAIEEEFDRSCAARQSVVSIGSRMQVYTNKLRAQLHEMQGEHQHLADVARDLMSLDQEIGPADCLAASIVVIGGSDRPGRQWQTPQPLLSVVRGGLGRIKEYKRVQLRRLPETGVDGRLVDHLTLIIAHLLDNATRYSPPSEQVILSAREVPNGMSIEILDVGTGLKGEKKERALELLHGRAAGPGPGGIEENAQLGLIVVGNLARKHDITVTFDDSPWLGTAVIVLVPHRHFKPLSLSPIPVPGERHRAAVPAQRADDVDHAVTVVPAASGEPFAPFPDDPEDDEPFMGSTTPGGLPMRTRQSSTEWGAPQSAQRHEGGDTEPVDTSSVPPEESFTGLAAFISGERHVETPAEKQAETPAERHTEGSDERPEDQPESD